jgi:hypothetical protein
MSTTATFSLPADIWTYSDITANESDLLVGPDLTTQVIAACPYCYDRDDRGVPVWITRLWIGLLARVMREEAYR